jgi:hypothetical protein
MSSIQQTKNIIEQAPRDEEVKQSKTQKNVSAQDVDSQRKLKLMQGQQFNIIQSKLDIAQDVTCYINYSGPNIYKVAAHQIESLLSRHFPGLRTECNRLTEAENMIDIRLRKGVAGGDEFLHYLENINAKEMETTLAKEVPVIVNKIDLELISMGFEFDFSILEADKSKKAKLPFLEEFMNEVENKQKHRVLEGTTFNITHDKLQFETDVACLINWSGGNDYKEAVNKLQAYLNKHYPGMQFEINKLHEKESMIDIRLRKGVTGGDEFIYYMENVDNKELQNLDFHFRKVVRKINNELVHMGFEFNFEGDVKKKGGSSQEKSPQKEEGEAKPKLDEVTTKIHKLMDELDEFAKQKAQVVKEPVHKIQQFLSSHFPGISDFFTEFQAKHTLKTLESRVFNITHEKLSIDKDVTCIINFSGGNHYGKAVEKINCYLKQHFPGMIMEINKLPGEEKMIDVRLRKGVTGGDEFIHYIEGIKTEALEDELASDLPQIVNKLNLELINMGFRFEFKDDKEQTLEQPFKHTKEQLQKSLAEKTVNKIEAFLQRFTPGILNYLEEVQGWQKLRIMQNRPFNIKHTKLDISQDVTCLINYSGPDVYKVASYRIDEWLHKHYPGMRVETMRVPEKENYIDIRLRKGVTGGDEFLHYVENIDQNSLETVLATELPSIVNKLNLELINMGFRFNFDTAKEKKEIGIPFHETKMSEIQANK